MIFFSYFYYFPCGEKYKISAVKKIDDITDQFLAVMRQKHQVGMVFVDL